jgi:ATP phosphoribosyltransferase
MSDNTLRLGLPKGSLQESTLDLLRRAGFPFKTSSRSYFPSIDDDEINGMLVRAQEMARYVEEGVFDAGFTGKDWIIETSSDVVAVEDLIYSKASMRPVRWVLAAPENSDINSVQDLQGKRIATEVVNITRRWLEEHGVEAEVEFSWGATEAKCPELVDAIVEVTETGNSLRANKLKIVDVLMESNTQLIANKAAWNDPWKRRKIESIAMLMQAAIRADGRVVGKMNALEENVEAIIDILPALRRPTVAPLAGNGGESWVAIETVIEDHEVSNLIPELRRAGAEGILEYSLNKILP